MLGRPLLVQLQPLAWAVEEVMHYPTLLWVLDHAHKYRWWLLEDPHLHQKTIALPPISQLRQYRPN